ncbi:MAG: sulfotransferase domain-containing protein [Planctomycetaceae bacterium]
MIKQLANQLKTSLGFGKRKRLSDLQTNVDCGFNASQSALVVHGLHKSATMFLYKFFADLCGRIDVPIYSIHNGKTPEPSIDHSFVLCPVRSFKMDGFSFPSLSNTRHLFQIRDPRDVLVSEYYSIGWRHSVEGWPQEDLDRRELIRTLSIDEYVLREPEISKYPLVDRFEPLMSLEAGAFEVIKYETMVTDFPAWLNRCLKAVDIDSASNANANFVTSLLDRYRDEFRADQSESAHKRNVTPGDHRNKLKPKTVEVLNDRFAAVLNTFEYKPDARASGHILNDPTG